MQPHLFAFQGAVANHDSDSGPLALGWQKRDFSDPTVSSQLWIVNPVDSVNQVYQIRNVDSTHYLNIPNGKLEVLTTLYNMIIHLPYVLNRQPCNRYSYRRQRQHRPEIHQLADHAQPHKHWLLNSQQRFDE